MRDRMNFDRSQFHQGDDVLGLNGDKIGSVSDVGPDYLHVSTGFLGLGQDLYIPFEAITRVQGHDIYLDVTKDEIHNRNWSHKPSDPARANEGVLTGTMPAASAETPTETPRYADYNTTNPRAIPGGTGQLTPETWIGPRDVQGKTLVDVDGREIGNVNNIGSNYLEVPTGLLNLGPTLYVPFTAISHCTPSKCFLNMPLGEIQQQGWNQRPNEGMVGRGAAPGTPMPSPAPTAPPRNTGDMAGAFSNSGRGSETPTRIPVYSEELAVNRQRQQVGEVVVTKNVVQEQRSIDVPVTHEEVKVERRPVDRDIPVGENAFSQGQNEIRVPIYEERVEVEKRPRVREEVVVQPEEVTEQRRFTETVRREEVNVNRQGDVQRMDSPPGRSWNDVMPRYRQEWQRRSGSNPSANWNQVEPAYRYGYENYNNPRFRGQGFDQAEPELRRQWEQNHPGNAWDRVKNDVRAAWRDVTGH